MKRFIKTILEKPKGGGVRVASLVCTDEINHADTGVTYLRHSGLWAPVSLHRAVCVSVRVPWKVSVELVCGTRVLNKWKRHSEIQNDYAFIY